MRDTTTPLPDDVTFECTCGLPFAGCEDDHAIQCEIHRILDRAESNPEADLDLIADHEQGMHDPDVNATGPFTGCPMCNPRN